MFILAFIGLIFIFWVASRLLMRLSIWLTTASYETADYLSLMKKKKAEEDFKTKTFINVTENKIKNIKGDSDVEYHKSIRNEIASLEREINNQ